MVNVSRIEPTVRQANGPFFYGKETYLSILDASGQNLVPLKTENVGLKCPSLQLTAWR